MNFSIRKSKNQNTFNIIKLQNSEVDPLSEVAAKKGRTKLKKVKMKYVKSFSNVSRNQTRQKIVSRRRKSRKHQKRRHLPKDVVHTILDHLPTHNFVKQVPSSELSSNSISINLNNVDYISSKK